MTTKRAIRACSMYIASIYPYGNLRIYRIAPIIDEVTPLVRFGGKDNLILKSTHRICFGTIPPFSISSHVSLNSCIKVNIVRTLIREGCRVVGVLRITKKVSV